MATSLDEAVEQLFVGWTPAPPASDHTSYGTSPNASLPHHNYKPSAHSKKPTSANTVQSSAKPQDAEAAAGQSQTSLLKKNQGANEGWGEWESPFNSGSTSPDTCSQGPAAATPGLVGIPAWRAKTSGHDQAGLAAAPQQQHAKTNHAADSFLRSVCTYPVMYAVFQEERLTIHTICTVEAAYSLSLRITELYVKPEASVSACMSLLKLVSLKFQQYDDCWCNPSYPAIVLEPSICPGCLLRDRLPVQQ